MRSIVHLVGQVHVQCRYWGMIQTMVVIAMALIERRVEASLLLHGNRGDRFLRLSMHTIN
jgi:hypothetical protein